MIGCVARAHTEERRRRWEECFARDEETSVKSEAAKHRVDGWLAGRVESAEKEQGVVADHMVWQAVRRQQLWQVAHHQMQSRRTKVMHIKIMPSRE